jgi:hypothetical protein
MKIQSSLDWFDVSKNLTNQLESIGYNPDLKKMYKNIEGMIEGLSKLEVDARRTHKPELTKPNLDKINSAIDHLEKLILMAKLMI